jgi:hypothetical protein
MHLHIAGRHGDGICIPTTATYSPHFPSMPAYDFYSEIASKTYNAEF